MSFYCVQCGECCSHLGLMFRITEALPDYSFLVQNEYTGEKHTVTVTPSLRSLFDDIFIFTLLPEACPFFRKNIEDNLYYCTVHLTRPEVCREYGCWRFLILDSKGNRAGRIMGTRHLHAEHPGLRRVWDEKIAPLIESDDAIWDKKMCAIIKKAGFTIQE